MKGVGKRFWMGMICLLVAGWSPAFAAGTIQGKVSYADTGLAGATVLFYAVGSDRVTGSPHFEVPRTEQDGSFELMVAPGQYFLLAKKYADPAQPGAAGDIFAYFGGNPVVVGEGETIHVGINGTQIQPRSEKAKPGGTGIRGRVFADGKPLSRARVTLYQDTTTIFRGIGYASAISNDQGDFAFSLAPGDYYVIARKRMGDEKMGPLAEGDLFGFAHDNPVRVEQDLYTVVNVSAASKNVKLKQGGQDMTLGGTVKAGSTTLSGVIRDGQGKPVANIFAAAYRDAMMTMKPDFISPPTGSDGVFTLSLADGGEYYLGARNTLGGPAERGDLLGRYAGNEDHLITIATGEKRGGIDIVVEPVE